MVWRAQEALKKGTGSVGLSKKIYDIAEFSAVSGHDIACGQKDRQGKPAPWCKVCGEREALETACDANPKCVAYEFNRVGKGCRYLKAAKGPLKDNPRRKRLTWYQWPLRGLKP